MHLYSGAKVLLFIGTVYLSIFFLFELTYSYGFPSAFGVVTVQQRNSGPFLGDPKLKTEVVFRGINFPTSMAFLGDDDILVLEKNEGTVRRIVNGVMLADPLLKVNVSSAGERGMLGIAIPDDNNNNNTLSKPTYVFLYYTEADSEKALEDQSLPGRNKLYRYELVDGKLVNPKLLLDLPRGHGTLHNGGVVLIGMDNNVYLIVGDMLRKNPQDSELVVGTAGILRIDQEGNPVKNQDGQYDLGNTHPLNKYYAFGIRNGFGMDFDPVTGNLWDTENGPTYGDEINLVGRGSNSGWGNIQGFWTGRDPNPRDIVLSPDPKDLADFGGKLTYSPPEFAVYRPIGFTALTFLNTTNYGKEYENDILVGDFNNGNLYRLELTKSRDQLQLNGHLKDRAAYNMDELKEIILGWKFGGITDIEIGPDGNVYVLSLYQGGHSCDKGTGFTNCIYDLNSTEPGTIFRIGSAVVSE